MGHNESSAKRKVHSMKCPGNEIGKICTNNVAAHLKALEQKEANTLKRSTRQEEVKLRDKINQVKSKNQQN
jgi:protein-arginine kinase activator protein McsA